MALPSSPPLLPELDRPGSQSLPILSDDFGDSDLPRAIVNTRPAIGPSYGAHSRKRHFSDYDSLSSDPLFSEGTSDSEGANDQQGVRPKRKRLVRGPWWKLGERSRSKNSSLRKSIMARREGLRNADSGVFMGSDMSDDSVDSVMSSQQKMEGLGVEDESEQSLAQSIGQPPGPEDFALERIRQCLENSREAVDLTNFNLTNLSNETLKPLHQLIRASHKDLTQPPSEDEFTPLTPSIQLFLSTNKLAQLPPELFNLVNISVLSLRNNELTQISPSIQHLRNLEELNIAQNRLRHLPWEMLDLLTCQTLHRRITLRPNPFVQPVKLSGPSPLPRPDVSPHEYSEHLGRWGEYSGYFFGKMKEWYSEPDVEWTLRHEMELRLKLARTRKNLYEQERARVNEYVPRPCNEELIFLASSAVRYYEPGGSLWRAANAAYVSAIPTKEWPAVFDPLEQAAPSSSQSTTPSLMELTLRTAQRNFTLTDLPPDLPSSLRSGLESAARGTEFGNEVCSTCCNEYIVPRAEWVEYWFQGFPGGFTGLTEETVLPFLRKACSWACVKPSDIGAFKL